MAGAATAAVTKTLSASSRAHVKAVSVASAWSCASSDTDRSVPGDLEKDPAVGVSSQPLSVTNSFRGNGVSAVVGQRSLKEAWSQLKKEEGAFEWKNSYGGSAGEMNRAATCGRILSSSTHEKQEGREEKRKSGAQRMLSQVRKNISVMSRAGSNTWASCFNIRVEVDSAEQMRLLSAKRLINGEPEDTNKHWLRKCLEGRAVAKALKCLALLSMVYAPVQFALEPSCEREGHDAAPVLQVLNFVCSCIYLGLSAGQFKAIITEPAFTVRGLHYIYLRLLVDIIAQGGLLAELVHLAEEAPSDLPTVTQGFMLLGTLKAWRVFFPFHHTGSLLQGLTIEVLHLFFWLVFAAHLSACFFLTTAMFERKSETPTWMDKLLDRDEELSCTDIYAAAVYFCTYTLTSIGYGDYVPANAFEHMACVVFMLASQMFAAKIFADLAWITTTHHFWKAQHHARLTQTAAALDSMGAHPSLRQRVLSYQDFIEQEQRERRAQECMQDLSQPLREELKLVVYYDLVIKAPFLQEQPIYLVRAIVTSLSDVVYLPCDVIIRMGDLGSELYFLRNGRAGVFKTNYMPEWTDEPIFVLRNGSYFGEVALLTGQPRASWVVAKTFCVCSVLPQQVMDTMMKTHPQCISGLVASLKNALGLTPKVSWEKCSERLRQEFKGEDQLYEFACNGDDGEAPAGLITWNRFDSVMTRLHVSDLDKKLLWVDLDRDCCGIVHYSDLRKLVRKSMRKLEKSEGDESQNQSERPPSSYDENSSHGDFGESENPPDQPSYTGPASAGTGEERLEVHETTPPSLRKTKVWARRRSSSGMENASQFPAQGINSERLKEMVARLDSVTSQVYNLQIHLGCPAQENSETGPLDDASASSPDTPMSMPRNSPRGSRGKVRNYEEGGPGGAV